eukprot:gene27240-35973_t
MSLSLLMLSVFSISFAFPYRKFSCSIHRSGDKRASLCSLQAGTGFGFGSGRNSKTSDQNSTVEGISSAVVALKQQEVSSDRSIPKTLLSSAEPIKIVRARYGAYALGLGDFIIHTSHHSQKDYKKYLENALDPVKAMKAWRKEIVNANSEKFEFLKLNIISDDPSIMSNVTQETLANSTLPAKAVKFQVLVRGRGTNGKLVPFEEESIFVKEKVESITGPSSKGPSRSSRKKAGDDVAEQWYYSYGHVSPMKEEDVELLMKQVDDKYQTIATIRDKW